MARRKGYRHLAHRAGYSALVPSANAARDVTANLISLPETVRMCRWKPRIPNAVTYGGNMTEYKARMKLATESLPPQARRGRSRIGRGLCAPRHERGGAARL